MIFRFGESQIINTSLILIKSMVKTYFLSFIVVMTACFTMLGQESSNSKFVIVLDAGHGGKDTGKNVGAVNEKDIALKIVKQVGAELLKNKNIKVIYTRTDDRFLELYERANIANDAKADFFVSIHANAAANKNAKGNETFVLGLHRSDDNLEVVQRENAVILLEDDYHENYAGFDPNDPSSFATSLLTQEDYLDNSIEMAAQVQSRFEKVLKRRNRGVKQAGFAVLRLSYMPSVLIETGFITNTEERQFLNSAAGQKKVAGAIVTAIQSYQKNRDLNTFVVPQVEVPDSSPETSIEDDGMRYKIQIAASRKKIATKSYNFKKLPHITRVKKGKVYAYYTGKNLTHTQAQELLNKARKAGYTTAFIVNAADGTIPSNKVYETRPKTHVESASSSISIPPVETSIIYKVQIAASSNKIAAKSYNFKKLPAISRMKSGAIYRYFTGSEQHLLEIKKILKKAKAIGYKEAFIVQVKDGKVKRL